MKPAAVMPPDVQTGIVNEGGFLPGEVGRKAREVRFHGLPTALQQHMRVPALWNALPIFADRRESIPLQ
jgi:hypothetical protein